MSKGLRITDGEVHGQDIFRLMDSQGVPLELIAERLHSRGLAFNVNQFIAAALESKNYTYQRIRSKLMDAYTWTVGDPVKCRTFGLRLDGLAERLTWQ
jgi:alanyl-tRNA synthetase